MGLGSDVGKEAAQTIANALPGVEAAIEQSVHEIKGLVADTIVPIIANIMSDVEGQINRFDGATLDITPSGKLTATLTATVDIPTFSAKLNAPLKPSS